MHLTTANFTTPKGSPTHRTANVEGGQYVMNESGFCGEWRGRYYSDDGSVVEFGEGTRSELIARFNAHEAACAI